jgi:hypothetical protein
MKRKLIPDTAALWENRIVNQDLEDKCELQRLLLTIKSEALSCGNSSEDIKYADYLDEMIKFYRLPHANDTEDNLVDRLKLLLNDHQLVLNANIKHLESDDDYIPDYKVSCEGKSGKLFDLFIVEAKLSEKAYFPHQDDFIKLRLEMQSMLNSLIKDNVSDPFSFGMISKGLTCKLVMMWLQYDGQYICRDVGSFSLPNSHDQIVLCPGILCTMLTLKERIDQLVERIKTSRRGSSPIASYMRTGFKTPALVRDPLTEDL